MLGLLSALAAFIECRFALFASESRTALGQLLGALACLIGGLVFFLFGYVFLVVSVIVAIARLAHVEWPWVAFAAAIFHFALVLALFVGARAMMSKPLFRELAAELRKDREWLRNLEETSRPGN